MLLFFYAEGEEGMKQYFSSVANANPRHFGWYIFSDGVEYSAFEYEYRVLAFGIFEHEYWWLTSSTSITSTSTEYIFAVKFYILKSVADIYCINWNHFF